MPPATLIDEQPPSRPTAHAPAPVPLIELRNVSKSYSGNSGTASVTVLDNISLEVKDGEMLALLGQSGSGKSTILRLIAGLTKPTAGTVLSHGTPLKGLNERLSIVFQTFALYPWLTVRENVQVGMIRRRLDARAEEEEVDRVLAVIGLTGYENAYPKQLSGGMRQRVGFARALVAQPEVLCMDEPFSALDVLTAENLRTQVVDLWRSSQRAGLRSIFLVTHNIAEAVFMATRIIIISSHPGRVRNIIANALPYPRDVNSPAFATLVDEVHEAITKLVLPDEPAERIPAGAAVAPIGGVAGRGERLPPSATPVAPARVETIPAAPVEAIVGLLEILEDSQETINVFDLSARISKEFGETIAIVKAAEMLGLVDTPKDDVIMTELGWYFLAAPGPVRQTLFREAVMKLRLFQILRERLEAQPDGRVSADTVMDELAALLPYDQPSKVFETLIAWGRYAEVVDFDQDANAVHLHGAGEAGDSGAEPSAS